MASASTHHEGLTVGKDRSPRASLPNVVAQTFPSLWEGFRIVTDTKEPSGNVLASSLGGPVGSMPECVSCSAGDGLYMVIPVAGVSPRPVGSPASSARTPAVSARCSGAFEGEVSQGSERGQADLYHQRIFCPSPVNQMLKLL